MKTASLLLERTEGHQPSGSGRTLRTTTPSVSYRPASLSQLRRRVLGSSEDFMHKILIVDDEEAARYGIRRALETRETQILEAASAEAARATIKAHQPHLMLADINMPGEDGVTLLKSLADNPQKP